MIRQIFKARLLALVLVTTTVGQPTHGFFDFFTGGLGSVSKVAQPVDITFLTDGLEIRKRQLEQLSRQKEDVLKEAQEAQRLLKRLLNVVQVDLSESKRMLRDAISVDAELVNKKISLINDRIQTLTTLQEVWRAWIAVLDGHLKHVRDMIDLFTTGGKDIDIAGRQVFTIKELNDTESRKRAYDEQHAASVNKKENLLRQKIAEIERLTSLKKELEIKSKEKEKMYATLTEQATAQGEGAGNVSLKIDIVDQEVLLIKEKTELAELKLRKLTAELAHADDEIASTKTHNDQLAHKLNYIKRHLFIDPKDAMATKDEWKEDVRRGTVQKDQLLKEKELKRSERDQLARAVATQTERFNKLKEAGEDKTAEGYFLDADIARTSAILSSFDRQLALYDVRRELITIGIDQKFFVARSIHVRQRLQADRGDINEWITEFKTRKTMLENDEKVARNRREEALNSLAQVTTSIDTIQKKSAEVHELSNTIFKGRPRAYAETMNLLHEAETALGRHILLVQEYITTIAALIPRQELLINQYENMLRDLDAAKVDVDVWRRSSKAISLDGFRRSMYDGEAFLRKIFWDTPNYLHPGQIISLVYQAQLFDFGMLGLFIILFMLAFIVVRLLLSLAYRRISYLLSMTHGRLGFIYLSIAQCGLSFTRHHMSLLYTWLFLYGYIHLDQAYGGLLTGNQLPTYFVSLFYLASIPIATYLAMSLLRFLQQLNKQLSFVLFNERSQHKFLMLIACALYAGAFLLPFRAAFVTYGNSASELPSVLLAAFSLIFVIVALLFFSKEDVLKLLPTHNAYAVWFKHYIDRYYYPVFGFFMGLLILSNPYIGYSHLAWFLAFALPASVAIISGTFLAHHYVRKLSVFIFIREDDEEIIDKFEHAKMYYGFFIIISFLALCMVAYVLIARIWGATYTLEAAWRLISEDWTFKLSAQHRLGLIQLLTFSFFILGGFVISSLVNRYILDKLFDIFRTEPGAQNTISRILHYSTVVLMIILGLLAINLSQLIIPFGTVLLVGIGIGLRDQISDFLAGLLVLLERQIEIGHFIETDGVMGTVNKISVRSTTIRTARNFSVIIPNRDLISKPIVNWGCGRYAIGCEITIRVDELADVDTVKSVLQEVIYAHPMVLRVPTAVVRLEDVFQTERTFFIRAFISSRKVREMWEIASDIRMAIVRAFTKHKIHFALPHQVIHFGATERNNVAKNIEIKFTPITAERDQV